jgi:hypothetical protein
MPFTYPLLGSRILDQCSLTFGRTASGGAQSSVRYFHPITVNRDVGNYIELIDNTDSSFKYAKFYNAEEGNTFRFTLEQNFLFSSKETALPFNLHLGVWNGSVFQAEKRVFTVWTDVALSPDPIEITLDNTFNTPVDPNFTGLYLAMSVPPNEAYNQSQDAIITIQRV